MSELHDVPWLCSGFPHSLVVFVLRLLHCFSAAVLGKAGPLLPPLIRSPPFFHIGSVVGGVTFELTKHFQTAVGRSS